MTPAAWAAASARQIWIAIWQARVGVEPPLVRQHVGEIDPVEVLHDEVGAAVLGRAEVGDVDDVGVADARGRARLAPEALDQLLLGRVVRVQDLDRDPLADLDVLAGVDRPHAALADLAQHAVAVVDHAAGEVDAQRLLLAREREPGPLARSGAAQRHLGALERRQRDRRPCAARRRGARLERRRAGDGAAARDSAARPAAAAPRASSRSRSARSSLIAVS